MKNTILLMIVAITILSIACDGNYSPSVGNDSKPEVKIYVFTVGEILVKDISLFSPGIDEGQSKLLTNTAYLIRHPKGDLIWDTGLPDALAEDAEGNDTGQIVFKMPITLKSQLESIAVSPDEIEYLAVSHIHGDHIGNVNLFTSSILLFQQEDYDSLFNPEKHNPAVSSIRSNEVTKLNGDHDVFGDGSVVIKRAPGHTPGHQVLYVDLPETGPIVLSGDLYHFTKNRAQRGVPVFNYDKDLTLKTMDIIEAFLVSTNATLWIQHDAEQNATIPHAPDFVK